ncbi:Proton-activated chloride channel [Galemys pyrenaicus]|uniref:Proton-activated chloride channel n=1 Tax=Galemys pyrenaicus TaxID=202257 RepID=A0A8J5ZML8_GALPY|nr:Proton-activated chloride channel [Galemys pyrenaicus]
MCGHRLPSPGPDGESAASSLRVSRACLQNVFSVLLILIYLLLMAVAVFLVYQTITDFREKLKHPVMSVSYEEVDRYDAPGIALYPGRAQLLSCEHHYEAIPPLRSPGQPGAVSCTTQRVNYTDPFSNQTLKSALVVRGPREVKKRELVFLQFRLNQSSEDFSAIDYLLFSSFQELLHRCAGTSLFQPHFRARRLPLAASQEVLPGQSLSGTAVAPSLWKPRPRRGRAAATAAAWLTCRRPSPDRAGFMRACESAYSSWKFSGGFRTWVKMSLVKTKEEDGREAVEFRQETSVVNYNDQRPDAERSAQLFFVVFEWKDPFIQEVQDVSVAKGRAGRRGLSGRHCCGDVGLRSDCVVPAARLPRSRPVSGPAEASGQQRACPLGSLRAAAAGKVLERPETQVSMRMAAGAARQAKQAPPRVFQIITANPWNTIALLCGAFLALFKAAEFAKLSVKWMMKIRKRYLRRGQAASHIS